MNHELLQRLRDAEDNFTEFKAESARQGDLKRTLVAFANCVEESREGVLFIGVADDGSPLGVKNPDSLQKKIRDICKRQCYPPINFQSEVLPAEGKTIVAVVVRDSKKRPHFAGPAYVREGSVSVIASEEVFEDLITSRTDTGRAILKHKGEIITVLAHGKRLGIPERVPNLRSAHTCRVEACNPHYVTLFDCDAKQMVTEPLENITVSLDQKRSRFQLDVERK